MTQLIGHHWAVDLLRQQVEHARAPQALLISGPPNVGKATLAKLYAQMLNCTSASKPCHQCRACRQISTDNHPDVRIFDSDESLKIETIREIQHSLALSPVEGRYRVLVLANFERATTSAANALLKTLEEPNPQVVLILTAVEPRGLLPTIVSRCQIVPLRALPADDVRVALQTHWQVDPEHALLLSQLSGGRLGWALHTLQDGDLLQRRQTHLETLLNLLQSHRDQRLKISQSLSKDVPQLKEALAYWLTLCRDLLLLKVQSHTTLVNVDWREQLIPLTSRLTVLQLTEITVRLRDALTNLERNVNPRLNLDVVVLKLPKVR